MYGAINMSETEKTTLAAIHQSAMKEFTAKGFRAASLRNIVKQAGVTTGAFYGYYKSKEALFDALVGPHYEAFLGKFREAQVSFANLPPQEQLASVGKISGACMDWMADYAYDHLAVFQLILCGAEGTRYAHLLDEMIAIETQATHAFAEVMERQGKPAYHIDAQLEHMLISGMFSTYFELFIHNVPRQKAAEYIRQFRAFYTAGWQQIMGF